MRFGMFLGCIVMAVGWSIAGENAASAAFNTAAFVILAMGNDDRASRM